MNKVGNKDKAFLPILVLEMSEGLLDNVHHQILITWVVTELQ